MHTENELVLWNLLSFGEVVEALDRVFIRGVRVPVQIIVISHNIHEIEQRERLGSDILRHPLSRSSRHLHISFSAADEYAGTARAAAAAMAIILCAFIMTLLMLLLHLL